MEACEVLVVRVERKADRYPLTREQHTGEMLLPVRQERHVVGRRGSLEDQRYGLEVSLREVLAPSLGEGMSGDEGRERQCAEGLHGFVAVIQDFIFDRFELMVRWHQLIMIPGLGGRIYLPYIQPSRRTYTQPPIISGTLVSGSAQPNGSQTTTTPPLPLRILLILVLCGNIFPD